MSLEKHGLYFLASCDHCAETLDTEEDEWLNGIAAMKAAGWRIKKKQGEWDHECSACLGDEGDDFEDVS